jgi:hypothetical protein
LGAEALHRAGGMDHHTSLCSRHCELTGEVTEEE